MRSRSWEFHAATHSLAKRSPKPFSIRPSFAPDLPASCRERPRCRHTAEQRDELAPPKRVRPDHKCVGPFLHQVRKGYIDLAIAARGENVNLPPNGGTRLPRLYDLKFSIPTIRIDEHGKACL